MRVKIVGVSPLDASYWFKEELVGQVGEFIAEDDIDFLTGVGI